MPWKGEKDPYLIWLSEIILQQTRVAQGTQYFLDFKKNYPTICDLAKASEDEVLKLWQGLGYYSRARNLHHTAKVICHEMDGEFPTEYAQIVKLKGVGSYTASAIASFAYNLPYAVVDGNVIRILSRFHGIDTPFDTSKGKKEFQNLADKSLIEDKSAQYNQAIMDFGATVCLPKNPQCANCVMQSSCKAFKFNSQDQLPVKSKKLIRKHRFFYYLIFKSGDCVLIEQRKNKDIWQNLYQFPLLETNEPIEPQIVFENSRYKHLTQNNNIQISKTYTQLLTHQKIHSTFLEIQLPHLNSDLLSDFLTVRESEITNFAYPKIIDDFIRHRKKETNH